MPGLNKHQSKTEATRRKLLQAAQKIFARDGFEAARIEDIASEIGCTRGAFYAHFRNKEDLFLALLEEGSQQSIAELRTALEAADSIEGRLTILRRHYASRLKHKEKMVLILEWKLFAIRHPERRAQLAAAHRRIRRSLHMRAIHNLLKPLAEKNPKTKEFHFAVLESILGGLVLERAYDPTRISQSQAETALERLFSVVTSWND